MDCRWSCMSKMKKNRKPGGGRKKSKPEYDARVNLKEQMESAVELCDSERSLQAIAYALALNPIKVRKLLITAGVKFKTYSGLPFTYEVRKGRNGEYTKELWIDRREKSKSLAWSIKLYLNMYNKYHIRMYNCLLIGKVNSQSILQQVEIIFYHFGNKIIIYHMVMVVVWN